MSLRSLGAGAAAGLLVISLAACGEPSGQDGAVAGRETGSGAFPVTLDHIWGSTTVAAEPQRVVVLGVTDADAVLALGTVPLAVTTFSFYTRTGVGPWAEEYLEGEDVDVLESDSDVDLEAVAAYEPDLIIGVSAGFDEPVYEQLTQIAPTLVRPAGTAAYTVSRDDATLAIAQALGREEEGRQLVDEANAAFETAVEANPDFDGAIGTVLLPYSGLYGAYLPGDARGQFMDQLGFELPEAITAEDAGEGYFVELSRERLNLVDGDVLVVLTDDSSRPIVEQDTVLQSLPVVQDGGLVLPDIDVRGAMTYNSVLSVPFAVENVVPTLADALDATS